MGCLLYINLIYGLYINLIYRSSTNTPPQAAYKKVPQLHSFRRLRDSLIRLYFFLLSTVFVTGDTVHVWRCFASISLRAFLPNFSRGIKRVTFIILSSKPCCGYPTGIFICQLFMLRNAKACIRYPVQKSTPGHFRKTIIYIPARFVESHSLERHLHLPCHRIRNQANCSLRPGTHPHWNSTTGHMIAESRIQVIKLLV